MLIVCVSCVLCSMWCSPCVMCVVFIVHTVCVCEIGWCVFVCDTCLCWRVVTHTAPSPLSPQQPSPSTTQAHTSRALSRRPGVGGTCTHPRTRGLSAAAKEAAGDPLLVISFSHFSTQDAEPLRLSPTSRLACNCPQPHSLLKHEGFHFLRNKVQNVPQPEKIPARRGAQPMARRVSQRPIGSRSPAPQENVQNFHSPVRLTLAQSLCRKPNTGGQGDSNRGPPEEGSPGRRARWAGLGFAARLGDERPASLSAPERPRSLCHPAPWSALLPR